MPSPHLSLQWVSQVLFMVPWAAPSSHCSPASLMPLPHEASGTYPLQSGVHDPGWPLLTPSSQTSPKAVSTALFPQKGAGRQRVVHRSLPYAVAADWLDVPASQTSPAPVCTMLSPQRGPSTQPGAQLPYVPSFLPSSHCSL